MIIVIVIFLMAGALFRISVDLIGADPEATCPLNKQLLLAAFFLFLAAADTVVRGGGTGGDLPSEGGMDLIFIAGMERLVGELGMAVGAGRSADIKLSDTIARYLFSCLSCSRLLFRRLLSFGLLNKWRNRARTLSRGSSWRLAISPLSRSRH